MFNLKGKKALVTGSTQGIGYAIAKALTDCGANVTVHGSADENKAARAARELSASGWAVGDLSVSGQAEAIFAKTGAVDFLILNASVQYRTDWDKIGEAELEKQLNVNFKSTLSFMQHYYPQMKANKFGRIITVGSVQQYRPHPQMAVYAATKCAVMSLVKNIAKQTAPYGVTINNISPGVIDTPRNKQALSDAGYNAKILAGIPAGFVGEPSDCAGAAVLLCSDYGRYITGTDIVVDGGMSL